MLREEIDFNNQNLNIITKNSKDTSAAMQSSVEWIRCRKNPLYYILNYVYLPEVGGKFKYSEELLHNKFRRVIRSLYKHHKCILMASRQLGKSSIAACMISWAVVFYPGVEAIILNMRKDAAHKNLATIKFIIRNLPPWMGAEVTSKSDIKSYMDLSNGSKVITYYPSTTWHPDTLARSLTSPVLYIDETAFIRNMGDIYGAAQQTLATARQQAFKNEYPYFILMTSTPNGTAGDGQFFYEMWQNGADTDLTFEDAELGLEDWTSDSDSIANDRSNNGFLKVQYHWSENPDKDDEWYQDQVRELNFNQRKINQELDLMFVGGTNCIFDDDTLAAMQAKKPTMKVDCYGPTQLTVFTEQIDPNDFYLIGVDTAKSVTGAFNAIEIFSFRDFRQVAEMNVRLGAILKYGDVVHDVFQWLYKLVGDRIILCIENNSIGGAVVEYLVRQIETFNYIPYIYNDLTITDKKQDMGIATTGSTKEKMVSFFHAYIKENPKRLLSQALISQLSTIESTNSGTIQSKHYSDMFMAGCFCAYVRKKKYLEILPMVDVPAEKLEQQFLDNIKLVSSMSSPQRQQTTPMGEDIFSSIISAEKDNSYSDKFDDAESFIPFFTN